MESEPGKGVMVSTVQVSAQVVAIDRKTRTVSLKGPEGNVVDVVAGERPGAAVARQVTAIADVVAMDPKNMTITLKGPRGNVVDLHVRNPDHFKVVKKGDEVEVTYTEALALSVEPSK